MSNVKNCNYSDIFKYFFTTKLCICIDKRQTHNIHNRFGLWPIYFGGGGGRMQANMQLRCVMLKIYEFRCTMLNNWSYLLSSGFQTGTHNRHGVIELPRQCSPWSTTIHGWEVWLELSSIFHYTCIQDGSDVYVWPLSGNMQFISHTHRVNKSCVLSQGATKVLNQS